MKRNIVLLLLLFSSFCVLANHYQSPLISQQAIKSFSKNYPGALYAQWQNMDDDLCVVRFVCKQQLHVIFYNDAGKEIAEGKMLETEHLSMVPTCVTNTLKRLFPVYQIQTAEEWLFQTKHHYYFEIMLPQKRLAIGIDNDGRIQSRKILSRG